MNIGQRARADAALALLDVDTRLEVERELALLDADAHREAQKIGVECGLTQISIAQIEARLRAVIRERTELVIRRAVGRLH